MNNDFTVYWAECLTILKNQITSVIFTSVIEPLKLISFQDDTFIFTSTNKTNINTIETRYSQIIVNTLSNIVGKKVSIKIFTEEQFNRDGLWSSKSSNLLLDETHSTSKYTFDTFVRGGSNDMAYSAALAVAQLPDKSPYNPLFLYGGVGLGKTHLMHSISNYIKNNFKNKKVLYLSSETFMNELIQSIQYSKNIEFREKYRKLDVLLIDDIQFIEGKESTQEEFFHTFNALYDENKLIVISSDKPPKDLKVLEERLRSRFSMGLPVDIKLPDFETRTAILEKKAIIEKIDINNEVTQFIAKNISSNIRDLEGALNCVSAYAKLEGGPITIEIAKRALQNLFSEPVKAEITIPLIQEIVANYYNITRDEINTKNRSKRIAYPRQIAMYLSRRLVDESLPKIGAAFNRDHTTIIHGCDKIAKEAKINPELQSILLSLEVSIVGEQ